MFGGWAFERRQVDLEDVAAAIEEAAVDDEIAVGIDDPGTDRCVGQQPPQHRAGGFGIDGEIEAAELVGVGRVGRSA